MWEGVNKHSLFHLLEEQNVYLLFANWGSKVALQTAGIGYVILIICWSSKSLVIQNSVVFQPLLKTKLSTWSSELERFTGSVNERICLIGAYIIKMNALKRFYCSFILIMYSRTSLMQTNLEWGSLAYQIVWITENIVLFTNLTSKSWHKWIVNRILGYLLKAVFKDFQFF